MKARIQLSEAIQLSAYVLVIIGTLGLLANEFVFAWGRPATLTFACANLAGLVALGFSLWGRKQHAH